MLSGVFQLNKKNKGWLEFPPSQGFGGRSVTQAIEDSNFQS